MIVCWLGQSRNAGASSQRELRIGSFLPWRGSPVLIVLASLFGCPMKSGMIVDQRLLVRQLMSRTQHIIDSLSAGAQPPDDSLLAPIPSHSAGRKCASCHADPTSEIALSPDPAEARFITAARCDSTVPGVVRGMLTGRFANPGRPPHDTLLRDALVLIRVDSPAGFTQPQERSARTGTWGQFYLSNLPTIGHYTLSVWHVLIPNPPYDYPDGFVQDIEKRCFLPSKDGPVPLSSKYLEVANER